MGLETMEQNEICKTFEGIQAYTYRWDRQGRKGQRCKVTARGKFNSIRVEFEDGYVMITSGNAIRRAPPSATIDA
jgi:hypothetical protein